MHAQVSGMKEELIALQPQLAVAAKETEAAMEVITRESAEADKVKVDDDWKGLCSRAARIVDGMCHVISSDLLP
jgi:hypothetical protein